jgi:hypothetical protein
MSGLTARGWVQNIRNTLKGDLGFDMYDHIPLGYFTQVCLHAMGADTQVREDTAMYWVHDLCRTYNLPPDRIVTISPTMWSTFRLVLMNTVDMLKALSDTNSDRELVIFQMTMLLIQLNMPWDDIASFVRNGNNG